MMTPEEMNSIGFGLKVYPCFSPNACQRCYLIIIHNKHNKLSELDSKLAHSIQGDICDHEKVLVDIKKKNYRRSLPAHGTYHIC